MPLGPEWQAKIWNVPPVQTEGACRICHGVSNQFDDCYKCGRLWSAQADFERVKLVVPCSVAVGGEAWYRAVQTYKAGSFDQYAGVLASVLSIWLRANGPRVSETLGGAPDLITVVPSKRRMHPTPLWQVAHAVPELRSRLAVPLRYVGDPSSVASRDIPIVDQFEVLTSVEGKRILLVEDTWVSGQTPISAALALAVAGATAVAVVAIARMVYADTMSDAYVAAAAPPYMPSWPK